MRNKRRRRRRRRRERGDDVTVIDSIVISNLYNLTTTSHWNV